MTTKTYFELSIKSSKQEQEYLTPALIELGFNNLWEDGNFLKAYAPK